MMSELSAAERWAWVGLLLMAGDSNVSGKIFLRKSAEHKLIGYSEETLAELLALTVDEFKKSMAKMIKFSKISVNKSGVITILNWEKYQSEYSRQRKYRESDNKSCNPERNQSNTLELDKDKDRDNKIYKNSKTRFCSVCLTIMLIEGIKTFDEKAKTPEPWTPRFMNWVDEIRKMRTIDDRDRGFIFGIIKFSQESDFWRSVILSTANLRKHQTKLYHQNEREMKRIKVSGIWTGSHRDA